MKKVLIKVILFGLAHILRKTAKNHPSFQRELERMNCTVQIRLKDNSLGRFFVFSRGNVSAQAGIHPRPDLSLTFRDEKTALVFLKPPMNHAEVIHAAKQFRVAIEGPDHLGVWFMQLLNKIDTVGKTYGTKMPDGTTRFVTNTNGGPLFVFVKDDKIVRATPMDFDDSDAPSWVMRARGKVFKPWRRMTVAPHALVLKSQVYSDSRILSPMKRVDFDPDGERNPQNRGKSGYIKITWDEALEIVAKEINRQKKTYGPGSIALQHSSHHQWGNVGYYLSALMRFGNTIGVTRVHHNPDSWEGWYWGAQHHFGNSLRVGLPGNYGTVEDCLNEAEQIIFWSSDPESTHGVYGGFEATQRRFWAQELGIEFVHIDPNYNPTAQLYGGKWIPIRPGTDAALAAAIMQVWIVEDLFDKPYVETRTTGFAQWRDYLLGKEDGLAKTPEWQEPETGVPARVARALARAWGRKKTYLAAGGVGTGFGGACRTATGAQWARNMILMMAMQGWGKPGVNFGNLQAGTPVDTYVYFPGYAEGGFSGELNNTASALNNYNRMPHVLSMNPVKQIIPRQRLPEAILEGKTSGHLWDGSSVEAQFCPYEYPMPGYAKVHMLYKYGGASFGTVAESSRFVAAYQHESIECIVNQSIYFEGDTKFADIILPACTSVERWDISEVSNTGGYCHHFQNQLNHRTVVMQHKCIEPLGESKSDYQIFQDILTKLGFGGVFTEGCAELDWCKRVYQSSDVARLCSWDKFLEKGYYVIPPAPNNLRDPAYMRWFSEARHKDAPEPLPLPAQFTDGMAKGLQTQSGKIEFVASSIARGDPDNPERPALNRYIPSWEGRKTKELFEKYPLQLIATHSRYSFHTFSDSKGSSINAIEDHRIEVDGYAYWVMRISADDAEQRGIRQHELIKVYNDRAEVICAADVSPLVMSGTVKTFESAAEFDWITDNGKIVDRGGCINLLTPKRSQMKNTSGMGSNSCLVQIEKWNPSAAVKAAFAAKA